METVYILIRAQVKTTLPDQEAINEINEDLYYDIGNTENVQFISTEIVQVTKQHP